MTTIYRGVLVALALCSVAIAQAAETTSSISERLTSEDVEKILSQGETSASQVVSGYGIRNPFPEAGQKGERSTRMHIAVVDKTGRFIKMKSMDDAWEGSKDIAIAKARTAAFFSSNENALTSRDVGELSQISSDAEGKINTGPLWGIGNSNQFGISGDKDSRNGVITFPGGLPLYKNGKLVGGVGVSGDSVNIDEVVCFGAAAGFEPGTGIVKRGAPHWPVHLMDAK